MNFIQLQFKSSALKKHERDKDPPQLYLNLIRECYRTLYVGMAQGVSFSLYIGIGAKLEIRRKPAKEGYVQLNIERSYYKLTLKASGYWSGNRTPIPVAIAMSGNWSHARHKSQAPIRFMRLLRVVLPLGLC